MIHPLLIRIYHIVPEIYHKFHTNLTTTQLPQAYYRVTVHSCDFALQNPGFRCKTAPEPLLQIHMLPYDQALRIFQLHIKIFLLGILCII